ncbi:MAG: MoaD/ThiS family protein [Acidobacteriota bacterium]
MRVYIPGPLRSYTKERAEVSLDLADGATMHALLEELDRQFPGIRFRMIDEAGRIREHIRLFVQGEQVTSLDAPIVKEVQIICAISGGLQR